MIPWAYRIRAGGETELEAVTAAVVWGLGGGEGRAVRLADLARALSRWPASGIARGLAAGALRGWWRWEDGREIVPDWAALRKRWAAARAEGRRPARIALGRLPLPGRGGVAYVVRVLGRAVRAGTRSWAGIAYRLGVSTRTLWRTRARHNAPHGTRPIGETQSTTAYLYGGRSEHPNIGNTSAPPAPPRGPPTSPGATTMVDLIRHTRAQFHTAEQATTHPPAAAFRHPGTLPRVPNVADQHRRKALVSILADPDRTTDWARRHIGEDASAAIEHLLAAAGVHDLGPLDRRSRWAGWLVRALGPGAVVPVLVVYAAVAREIAGIRDVGAVLAHRLRRLLAGDRAAAFRGLEGQLPERWDLANLREVLTVPGLERATSTMPRPGNRVDEAHSSRDLARAAIQRMMSNIRIVSDDEYQTTVERYRSRGET